MSLRSWYFIRVNRVFQGVFLGIFIFNFQNLSLGFLNAVFGVLKVVHCKIENLELNSDFLISTFYDYSIGQEDNFSVFCLFSGKNFSKIPKSKIHSKFPFRKFTAFKTPKTVCKNLKNSRRRTLETLEIPRKTP